MTTSSCTPKSQLWSAQAPTPTTPVVPAQRRPAITHTHLMACVTERTRAAPLTGSPISSPLPRVHHCDHRTPGPRPRIHTPRRSPALPKGRDSSELLQVPEQLLRLGKPPASSSLSRSRCRNTCSPSTRAPATAAAFPFTPLAAIVTRPSRPDHEPRGVDPRERKPCSQQPHHVSE